jgi:hypothetical protein
MVSHPGILTCNKFLSKFIFGKNSTCIFRFGDGICRSAQINQTISDFPPNAIAFGPA